VPEEIPDISLEFLADEALHRRVVTEGILEAKRLVRIATANLKDLHVAGARRSYRSILKPLGEFVRSGGKVHILHGGIPSRRFLGSLSECGLAGMDRFVMRRCPRLHFKAVLIDGRFVFLGSPNFTGAGLGAKSPRRRNFEMGIVCYDRRLFDLVEARYDTIWSGRACERCGRKNVCYVPLEEPDL